jgi:cytochrome c biogenesis protein CcmG/thiol:disulfide interchange protein DsbE
MIMNRVSRVILVITLASVLILGLVVSGCPGEPEQSVVALGEITGVSMDPAQSPQPSQPAPDFQFQTPEGQSTSLSQLKGQLVLVNFWATWCGPCTYEMPFLQQFYQEHPGDEVVLLAINVQESPSQVAEFMQSRGFSFTVLLDSQADVAQRYNVRGIPTTFFIDREGIIQQIHVGAFQSQAEIESILSELE